MQTHLVHTPHPVAQIPISDHSTPSRHAFGCLLAHCDVVSLARAEEACFQWREFMVSAEGVPVWQASVHRFIGRNRIERYKIALGLRSGQSYEHEKTDLTARNWKRILRMHRATVMLPQYHHEPHVVPLLGHTGPVLCMCLGESGCLKLRSHSRKWIQCARA